MASHVPPYFMEERMQRRNALKLLGLGVVGVIPLKAMGPAAMRGMVSAIVSGRESANGGASAIAQGALADGRIRQWSMIIDLRYCDGCQSQGTPPQCTSACIQGHYAPEPMQWIEVFEYDLEGGGTQFVPAPCQQCQNPPCVHVCPVAATWSTPEGPVLIDQFRCIGCRICMAACPYDRRFFNWGDPPIPPQADGADYSVEQQVPAQRGTVMKCDFCPDMVSDGTLPYCAQGCPNLAIYYGDLEEDVATNGDIVVKASRFLTEAHAYRLKEDLGTKPRVYYVPGHGELVGRDSGTAGRMDTVWPWWLGAEGGADTWSR